MSHNTMWQLQEAKSRFSEVVELAEHQPQVVTKHGKPTVAVISFDDFLILQASKMTALEALMPKRTGVLTNNEVDTLFKRDRDTRLPDRTAS